MIDVKVIKLLNMHYACFTNFINIYKRSVYVLQTFIKFHKNSLVVNAFE